MKVKIGSIENYPFIFIEGKMLQNNDYPLLVGRTILTVKEIDEGNSILN